MYASLTPQWAGTLLGLLEVVLVPIPFAFYKFGDRIRARSSVIREMREERARDDRKRARLAAKMERQQLMADGRDRGVDVGGDGVKEVHSGAVCGAETIVEAVDGKDVEKGVVSREDPGMHG